jgi:uncharacterized protein (DUF924 family)
MRVLGGHAAVARSSSIAYRLRMTLASPDEILDYWFGEPAREGAELMTKIRRWFQGGEETDREIDERFGATVAAALDRRLDGWAEVPRTRLALVLLLDQFTRNVYRGTPRMYEGDGYAQSLAKTSFDDGSAAELSFIEQLFLSMPLLHAEDLALQRREREIAAELASIAPELYRPMCAMHREQTAKYTGVIERFGRFPHRNAILGRTSTPEELELLADWAEKAPPSGAR